MAKDDLHALTGRRRLFLLRHGHVDYFDKSMTDPRTVNLTGLGRKQAEAARDALSDLHLDKAFCSGLPRTVQTANIILERHRNQEGQPFDLQQDLRFEEIKSVWIKDLSREELAARLAFCFDNAGGEGACFLPDGETFKQAETRIIEGLNDLIAKSSWKTGLLVAHEGVNRILLGWCTGGGLTTIGAFEQDLCAINVIDFDITISPEGGQLQIERAILKLANFTAYDASKKHLTKTCLEHLFDVDFGASRPKID